MNNQTPHKPRPVLKNESFLKRHPNLPLLFVFSCVMYGAVILPCIELYKAYKFDKKREKAREAEKLAIQEKL